MPLCVHTVAVASSIGSSSRVGGGAKKHEIYVAAFGGHLFYDLFVQGWGGHGPLGTPPGSTTGLYSINVCTVVQTK